MYLLPRKGGRRLSIAIHPTGTKPVVAKSTSAPRGNPAIGAEGKPPGGGFYPRHRAKPTHLKSSAPGDSDNSRRCRQIAFCRGVGRYNRNPAQSSRRFQRCSHGPPAEQILAVTTILAAPGVKQAAASAGRFCPLPVARGHLMRAGTGGLGRPRWKLPALQR